MFYVSQTGTLTENQMTAVEGWFSDKLVQGADIKSPESLAPAALDLVSQNIAINRSCTVRFKDEEVCVCVCTAVGDKIII